MRVIVPALTEDRRRDMVKVVHKKLEEHKVAVRNVRREVHDKLKAMEKDKSASADEVRRASERLQKLTDHAIAEMDALARQRKPTSWRSRQCYATYASERVPANGRVTRDPIEQAITDTDPSQMFAVGDPRRGPAAAAACAASDAASVRRPDSGPKHVAIIMDGNGRGRSNGICRGLRGTATASTTFTASCRAQSIWD